MNPEDTSKRDPIVHLAGMMGGASRYITEQESAGQAQLVNSTVLPIELQRPDTDADFEALGFTFGEKVDDLFREATLPEGWTRQGSDHAMWSHIVDDQGRERVAIFYKAAFYDRCSFMRISKVAADDA